MPSSSAEVKGILKHKTARTDTTKTVMFDQLDHVVPKGSPDIMFQKGEVDDDSEQDSDSEDEENQWSGEESQDSDASEEHCDLAVPSHPDSGNESEKFSADEGYTEDIYGRLRDVAGQVVGVTGSYVPPGKRLTMAGSLDEEKKLELEKMSRKIKGFVNRCVSDTTLQFCGVQMVFCVKKRRNLYMICTG